MVLSIGMIVKNEEKYLDRCLSALKPILDSIDSELIIADTGSTDSTVEIAKKYTENVFYFEWINDFAAARNSTLERAKGEWYMFLDADEIFESCDDIIRFFKTGEYKNYKGAGYTIKNYTNSEDYSIFSSFVTTRLFCLEPGMKFIGCVHEAMRPCLLPIKGLKDVAGHYGYLYNVKEIKEKKYKRNSELLLKRLETETPDQLLYLQLAQTFALEDEEKRLEYSQLGLDCPNGSDILTVALYNEKIYHFYKLFNWEKTIELCEEYFDKTEKIHNGGSLSTDADIYLYMAISYKNLGKNAKSIEAFKKFFELYDNVSSGKLFTNDVVFNPIKIAISGHIHTAVFFFVTTCMAEKEYETAAEYLKKVDISAYYVRDNDFNQKLNDDFEIMRQTRNYRRTQALYNHLDENGRATLKVFIRREAEIDNPSPEVNDLFRKIVKNEPDLVKLLDTVKEHFLSGNCLEKAKKLTETGLCTYYEILYYLVAEKQDISLVTALEKYNFKSAVNFCSDAFEDFYEALENYPVENISSDGLRGTLNLLESAMELSLRDNRDIEPLFTLWGIVGLAICEAENLGTDELSGQIFGAVMSAEAISEKSQGNIKDCLNALTALARQYPAAKPFITAISEKVQKQAQPASEMDALAAEFKKNIRMLIASGEVQQAEQLLGEYEKIMPDDSEINSLKNQIMKEK